MNVTRKKKKKLKKKKKMSLHSEHCRNEETFFISVPCETLHTDFLLVFSLFYHPLSSSTFFIPFLFFFFNLSRSFNWENTIDRRHHVASNCHIPICIYTNWSITLTPSSLFSFSPSLNYFISFDIIYRFRKNDPFAHELPFFFFFFFLISRPLRRYNEMWLRLRCARKNVRKAWSCIAWIKKLFNQSKGSLAWREGRDLSRNRIAADRAYLCRRAINPRRDNAS